MYVLNLFQVDSKDETSNGNKNGIESVNNADDEDIEVLRADSEDLDATKIIGESFNETEMNGDNLEDTISVTDLLDDEEIENILEDRSDKTDDDVLR